MTNPTNNTPSNHNDREHGHVQHVQHVQHVHPGPERPLASDPRRALLNEDMEYDVWLEECLAYAETLEHECRNDA